MSERLNILFLSHYFHPEGNAPANRVFEMCRLWAAAGHRVTVITCAPNCPNGIVYPPYRNRLWQQETIEGIRVVRVWTYLAANQGFLRRTMNYTSYMVAATLAAMAQRRPDVLLATSPQFFCGVAGMVAASLRRVPFILEVRDIWPDSIQAVGAIRGGPAIRALKHMEHSLYKSAAHIVTVGEGYQDELAARGVPRGKISIISNGVDRDLFYPRDGDGQARRAYGLGNSFVCAFVGTIGMACGLEVVIQAGQILKDQGRTDIKFLLVGDGATRGELQTQAQSLGLDNVVFTGRLDRAMIPPVLADVDACLVHLRKRELFKSVMPSKIFEASAMGKPIILGVQGHAAGIVAEAGAGVLIEPENAEALVAAAQTLAADPQRCRQMGHSGFDYVVKHFDRHALTQRYLRIIASVARREQPDAD